MPDLKAGVPAESVGGVAFRVGWEYKGIVYYAEATESELGSWSYSSGNTGPALTKGVPELR